MLVFINLRFVAEVGLLICGDTNEALDIERLVVFINDKGLFIYCLDIGEGSLKVCIYGTGC